MAAVPRIAVTPGEPAGIGPDLLARLVQEPHAAELVAVADADLLRERAEGIGLELEIEPLELDRAPERQRAGRIKLLEVRLRTPARAGHLDPTNAPYVLDTLSQAADGCMVGRFEALVTGPVHKGVINDAGISFTGHTEFLAERTGGQLPVMLLAAGSLRVALATTHLPLAEVPQAITSSRLEQVIRVLDQDLRGRFGIPKPRILVCGLNPHAGESGHLGREEIEIIGPSLERLRLQDIDVIGPLPADTVFTPRHWEPADAVLAMYHDQGLPVLKHAGFGRAVNVTLGLPIIRTSVDHGTALDLAGTPHGDVGSLREALGLAIDLAGRPRPA
jgi:4-hydroxythreonine-4-phosphate dehydrogenase